MCKPFIRWAGGKTRVAKKLEALMPEGKIKTYYEPFLGGGAMFFRLHRRVQQAVLSDINRPLIDTYNCIRNDVEYVVELLEHHAELHDKDRYHAVREDCLSLPTAAQRAASFIYINKVCYNGLWRVNKSGQCNVPMDPGKKKEKICDETVKANLRAASEALTYATIVCANYDRVLAKAEAGDFVYLDSPYYSIKGNSFTAYTAKGFTHEDQEKLADLYDELDKRGVRLMMSNAAAPWVQRRYGKYSIGHIKTRRSVGPNKESRREVTELVITNY